MPGIPMRMISHGGGFNFERRWTRLYSPRGDELIERRKYIKEDGEKDGDGYELLRSQRQRNCLGKHE